jgi:hypothetical protein
MGRTPLSTMVNHISAVSEKSDPLVYLTPVALVISAPFIFVVSSPA